MNSKTLKALLKETAEEEIPSPTVALWPGIKERLVAQKHPNIQQGASMKTSPVHAKGITLTVRIAVLFVILFAILLAIPQGRTFAQQILNFFTRAGSDQLPVQSWQQTPQRTPEILATGTPDNATPTADPANILDASQAVPVVEQQAGFDVQEPSWLPEVLSFKGATLESEQHIVRLFYALETGEPGLESNGLWLMQEPVQSSWTCQLCGMVGKSAAIEIVQIGDVPGEFVEGVWKLTDSGPVWEPDPYMKTLRWQANGFAFEIGYMGSPEAITKEDMLAIAQSLK